MSLKLILCLKKIYKWGRKVRFAPLLDIFEGVNFKVVLGIGFYFGSF